MKREFSIRLSPYLVAVPAAALSFAATGLTGLRNNNIYHVPILLRLYDLPQFADDAFVQSLRHFSSGFWLMFAGIGSYVDVAAFLLFWLFVAHYAFLAAAIHLARSLGQRDAGVLSTFVILQAVSSLACNEAVGGGGVMLDYFSHSELANASLILGLSSAIRKEYGRCVIWTALTFFLNAFMAVWMMLPLLCLLAVQLRAGAFPVRISLLRAVGGLVIGIPIVAVPLVNFLQAGGGAAPVFSYKTVIYHTYPFHFYILSLTGGMWLMLAGVCMAALVAAWILRSKMLLALVAGSIGAVALGSIATLLSDSRILLSLHLIRSAVVITMFCVIELALYAAQRLMRPSAPIDRLLGAVTAAALIFPGFGFLLAIPVMIVSRLPKAMDNLRQQLRPRIAGIASPAIASIGLLVLISTSAGHWYEHQDYSRQAAKWRAIGAWAKANTPPGARLVAVPSRDQLVATPMLEYTSERSVWYDDKFSAAVLWSPAYYTVYAQRSHVLFQVWTRPGKQIDIARDNGVDYLITACKQEPGTKPVHVEGEICVFGTKTQ